MMHRIANFRIERMKRFKAANYGATAGKVIVGNLARGGDGKFTSAGNARTLPTAKPKLTKPKKGRAAKPVASQAAQESIAASAGVSANDLRALQAFQAGGTMDSATAARLNTAGLVDIGTDSKPRLSPNVNTALNALKKGDARAASDALSKSRDRKANQSAADQKRALATQARADRKAQVEQRRADAAKRRDENKRKRDEAKNQTAAQRAEAQRVRSEAQGKTDAARITNRVEEVNAEVDKLETDGGSASDKPAQRKRMGNRLEEMAAQVDKLAVSDADKTKLRADIVKAMDRIKWGESDGETRPDSTAKQLRAVGGVTVYKEADGSYTWATYSSNAFEDRDREIVSREALAGAVDRMDARGEYGPARWWHSGDVLFKQFGVWDSACAGDGVDIGTCNFSAMHGRTLVEVGTFNDAIIDGTAYTAKEIGGAFAEIAPYLQVSIGFTHPRDEPIGGVYKHVNIFERSFLPKGKAANSLTGVVILKEANMQKKISGVKMAALKSILGGDDAQRVADLLAGAETVEKEADALGVRHKEADALVLDDDTLATLKEMLGDGPAFEAAQAAALAKLKADSGDAQGAQEAAALAEAKADPMAAADESVGEDAAVGDYIGDLSIDDYKALMTEIFAPVISAIEKLAGVADMQAKAIGNQDAIVKELGSLGTMVKQLRGDAPTGRATAYRPSQAKDTETEKPEVKQKQSERATVQSNNLGGLGSFFERAVVNGNGVAHKDKSKDKPTDDEDEGDSEE